MKNNELFVETGTTPAGAKVVQNVENGKMYVTFDHGKYQTFYQTILFGKEFNPGRLVSVFIPGTLGEDRDQMAYVGYSNGGDVGNITSALSAACDALHLDRFPNHEKGLFLSARSEMNKVYVPNIGYAEPSCKSPKLLELGIGFEDATSWHRLSRRNNRFYAEAVKPTHQDFKDVSAYLDWMEIIYGGHAVLIHVTEKLGNYAEKVLETMAIGDKEQALEHKNQNVAAAMFRKQVYRAEQNAIKNAQPGEIPTFTSVVQTVEGPMTVAELPWGTTIQYFDYSKNKEEELTLFSGKIRTKERLVNILNNVRLYNIIKVHLPQ